MLDETFFEASSGVAGLSHTGAPDYVRSRILGNGFNCLAAGPSLHELDFVRRINVFSALALHCCGQSETDCYNLRRSRAGYLRHRLLWTIRMKVNACVRQPLAVGSS
jgi:hypothetical protein